MPDDTAITFSSANPRRDVLTATAVIVLMLSVGAAVKTSVMRDMHNAPAADQTAATHAAVATASAAGLEDRARSR
jgi:hypothetical protein